MINEIYEKLCAKKLEKNNTPIKTTQGFFTDEDQVRVFRGGFDLSFIIDKESFLEVADEVIERISLTQYDSMSYNYFKHVIDVVSNSVNSYYGLANVTGVGRESYYMLNGEFSPLDEDERVLHMRDLKGLGIAKCAEKTAVANNVFMLLNEIGLFNFKSTYLEGLLELDGQRSDGHAFIGLERPDGAHIIFDITNPVNVEYLEQAYTHPALYFLTQQEYEDFINGQECLDNNKFLLKDNLPPLETRTYSGFSREREK